MEQSWEFTGKGVMGMDDGLSGLADLADLYQQMRELRVNQTQLYQIQFYQTQFCQDSSAQKLFAQRDCSILVSRSHYVTCANHATAGMAF